MSVPEKTKTAKPKLSRGLLLASAIILGIVIWKVERIRGSVGDQRSIKPLSHVVAVPGETPAEYLLGGCTQFVRQRGEAVTRVAVLPEARVAGCRANGHRTY